MQGVQRCARPREFSESREGMRREGPRFTRFEYPIQTVAGGVYICVGLLPYGQNPAYPIVSSRGQMCQISRIQAYVVIECAQPHGSVESLRPLASLH